MSILSTLKFITNHPFNRERRASAILRLLKWQIVSRLMPGAFVYDWANGSRLLIRQGETGVTGNLYAGLHEFADMAFVLHFLRVEDLFVDIGANVGSYTILACAGVGASGVAFEPIRSTFDRLVDNVRLNDLESRVLCVNKGVGDQDTRLSFSTSCDTTNHALADGERCVDAVDIDVVRLDGALGTEHPSLIKIDVEGYETAVLEGAKSVLSMQTLNGVIIELNGSGSRYGYQESRILELMADNGFQTYSYEPFERRLVSLNGKNLAEGNTLFIRDVPFVEERLRTAQKVAVLGREF